MPVRDDSVREQSMQVGGRSLRVAIRPGTGTGPPLLLCNGVGMRLEALRPFVDALDPAIEVIRFDAPGVGGSELPILPYRFTTLALLLREMLANLGHQQADVLGISWGGGLAQQFALLNPRLCRRLILVATATGPQTMVPPNPLPPVKALLLRRWGDVWGGSAKTDPDALARAVHKARISPLSLGFLFQHAAALGFTTLPLLPFIRQRTLVLTGDDDPIIPVANGRILAAGIPHATLHVYHGGHVELVTRPGLLTPLITSFLAAPPHDARRDGQAQTALPRPPAAPPGRRRAPRRPRAGRGLLTGRDPVTAPDGGSGAAGTRARSHIPRSGCRRRHPGCCVITDVIRPHRALWRDATCANAAAAARRFPVIRQLHTRGRIAGAISEQRLAVGGSLRAAARWPGGRTGAERGLNGGGDELRGLRVDGDVPAEQHAADDVADVAGRVLRAVGHVSPLS